MIVILYTVTIGTNHKNVIFKQVQIHLWYVYMVSQKLW